MKKITLSKMVQRFETERAKCAKLGHWIFEAYYRGEIEAISNIITLLEEEDRYNTHSLEDRC